MSSPVDHASPHEYDDDSRIIFASPEDWVVEQILSNLVQAEYKAVVLPDSSHLSKAIQIYKHSIVLFNIDKAPQGTTWYKIVEDSEEQFKQCNVLPVFIGKDTRDNIRSKLNISIPFEAFDMGRSPAQVMALIQAVIKQWYLRGKRQFIRVNCPDRNRAKFNLRYEGDLYQGTVLDISSTGMACEFDVGMEPKMLSKGASLSSIQLKLNNRLILVDGVMMGSRVDGTGARPTLWVMIFRNHVDTGSIRKIRAYVQDRLQEDFALAIQG